MCHIGTMFSANVTDCASGRETGAGALSFGGWGNEGDGMGRLKAMKPAVGALPGRLYADRAGLDRKEAERERSRQRDQAAPWRAWYKTARWQKLRRRVFARDGYRCQQTGALLGHKHPHPLSPVADHIKPHRGDPVLFWDETNIQTVSKEWHDSVKQAEERKAGGV